ncbi:hypothetical protein ES705_41422 [subsurface metagenome]
MGHLMVTARFNSSLDISTLALLKAYRSLPSASLLMTSHRSFPGRPSLYSTTLKKHNSATIGPCAPWAKIVVSHLSSESLAISETCSVDHDLYIAQEICQGKEFTVNCFYDRLKGCVSCVPHFRKLVRSGEVCFAEKVRIADFKVFADKF